MDILLTKNIKNIVQARGGVTLGDALAEVVDTKGKRNLRINSGLRKDIK